MRRNAFCGKCSKLKDALRSGVLRCTACHNNWLREYYHRSESRQLNQRRSYLQKKYGVSIEEMAQLLEAQHGLCAICGKLWSECHLEKRLRGKTLFLQHLYVDHCHRTGRVRGLLCNNCNKAIGLLSENKEHFARAIRYLEKYKKAAFP